MGWAEKTNSAVAKSPVGSWFRLEFSGHKHERKGSRFLKEIRAGLATFFAMAYIISVNASIVASSGGTCKCDRVDALDDCSGDLEYMKCVQEVNQDLVTATAAISGVSSVLLGVFSNMPIAMAPGMGVNAYFAYQVVGFHGTGGSLSYEMALTAVFAEGLIFAAMTIFGLRQWLARTIPSSLKIASGAGIGLYLALLGLTYDAGLGVVTGGMTTPLELAGCDPTLRNGTTGVCESGKMSNPTLWVGIACGGFVTSFLMMYRIKGALIMGILLVSIISWPRGTSVSLFPYTDIGEVHFAFFKKWKIRGENAGQFILTIVTFLYVDILDSTGTLYSMARFCGAIDEDTQDFEGSFAAYLVDAICISIGALLGCPPVTPYIESGAGISEGGATGLTAVVTGVCFLLSIFFAPIFASIPPWATGSALILVGAMMARAAVDINWRYVGDSVPAFLTLAVMPLTYSIAHGLIAGIVSYVLLNSAAWIVMKITHNRITPYDYDHSDYWTWRPSGGFSPGWLKRVIKGKRNFWAEYDYDEQAQRNRNRCRDSCPTSSDLTRTMEFPRGTVDFAANWEMPELPAVVKHVDAKDDVLMSPEDQGPLQAGVK